MPIKASYCDAWFVIHPSTNQLFHLLLLLVLFCFSQLSNMLAALLHLTPGSPPAETISSALPTTDPSFPALAITMYSTETKPLRDREGDREIETGRSRGGNEREGNEREMKGK